MPACCTAPQSKASQRSGSRGARLGPRGLVSAQRAASACATCAPGQIAKPRVAAPTILSPWLYLPSLYYYDHYGYIGTYYRTSSCRSRELTKQSWYLAILAPGVMPQCSRTTCTHTRVQVLVEVCVCTCTCAVQPRHLLREPRRLTQQLPVDLLPPTAHLHARTHALLHMP